MAAVLTANAIAAVNGGDLNLKPVVEVVEVKPRMIMSDGVETQQALLATQLNPLVKSGRLQKGSVVQMLEYIANTVQGRRIIVVLNLLAEADSCGKTRMNATSATNHWMVQPSYKPPPSYRNHGAVTKNEAPAKIIPIATLNPYQGRWAIKARVTSKGDLRRYNNARGDGKVFSFDLLDSDGGEIRATCFNKKATKLDNGNWCCDRCNCEFDECDYRYLLQAQVQDHTGLTWVTAFQDSGAEMLGCSAKELYRLKFEEGDDLRFGEIVHRCLFEQYLFKLKIKEELYGDEQRVKITVVKAEKRHEESPGWWEMVDGSAKELYRLKFEEGDDVRSGDIEQYLLKLKIKKKLYGDRAASEDHCPEAVESIFLWNFILKISL